MYIFWPQVEVPPSTLSFTAWEMPDSNQGSLPQKSGALPPHLHGKPPHFLPICFKLAAEQAEIAGNVSTPEPEGDTKDKAMMEQQIQVMKVTLNQKLFLFS